MAKWQVKSFYTEYNSDFRRIGQIPFVVEITGEEANKSNMTLLDFVREAIYDDCEEGEEFIGYIDSVEGFIRKHLQNETDVQMQTLEDGAGLEFSDEPQEDSKFYELWNQNPLFLINGQVGAGTAVGFIKQGNDIHMVLAVSILDNQDVCLKEYINGGYLPDMDADGKEIYDHYETDFRINNKNTKFYILSNPMNDILD